MFASCYRKKSRRTHQGQRTDHTVPLSDRSDSGIEETCYSKTGCGHHSAGLPGIARSMRTSNATCHKYAICQELTSVTHRQSAADMFQVRYQLKIRLSAPALPARYWFGRFCSRDDLDAAWAAFRLSLSCADRRCWLWSRQELAAKKAGARKAGSRPRESA